MDIPEPSLFDAEPNIIARIKLFDPTLRTVESGDKLAGAKDIAPLCPAVFILPGPGEDHASTSKGVMISELQIWHVILCVAHMKKADENTTAILAGRHLVKLIKALSGWAPLDNMEPLRYLSPRPEPYYEVGYAEFPILFESRYILP